MDTILTRPLGVKALLSKSIFSSFLRGSVCFHIYDDLRRGLLPSLLRLDYRASTACRWVGCAPKEGEKDSSFREEEKKGEAAAGVAGVQFGEEEKAEQGTWR